MTQDIHQWVEARLSEYLDNQLAPAELAQLETHLRECDRCSASLESLRQTISLLKLAPVPASSRQFTLPVTRTATRAIRPSFAILRVATVMATLVLCAVVSLDLFGSSRFASAPIPAAQFAAPAAAPTNIALAPTSAPAATSVPAAAPKPTSAPPQSAAQPLLLPTTTRVLNAGAAEAQATASIADQALKSSATAAAAPPAPRAAITTTLASPSSSPISAPSATASALAPTVTTQLQARAEATRARDGSTESSQPIGSLLRWLEIGLLALVLTLGALTIFAWRRK